MEYEVIVIGGGSAGYAAARTAAAAGAGVAIVDPGPLGGLCILRGCMPSKAILRSAEVMGLMRRAGEFGLHPVEARADLGAIVARKERLVREFAEYRIGQLRDPRFTLYEEPARFLSPHQVQVGARVLQGKRFVIATGSTVRHLALPGLDQAGHITSDQALELRQQSASMLVLGGGAVALELAQFFQRIGTRVTLIQRHHHVLSWLDEDLARPVEEQFRAEGMEVYTGTQLHRFSRQEGVRTAYFSHQGRERSASAEGILQALGRKPCVEGLGLEAAGVHLEHGAVQVDEGMRTNQPHIFAAGDVVGQQEIVHVAIHQGEVAGHNAARPAAPAQKADPRQSQLLVVFTDPEVASVGLTEKACQAEDIPYLAASYPFADHGKALCQGAPHGLVKLLCRPRTGEVIGGHITGPEGGELIHELVALMHFGGTVHDLLRMPHYHPTLAEILTYPAEELAGQLG
ncbi:MAG: FAD-dependent oxidoreductase [Candidatus Handelsmanbacteria bacterium]|nr:FAD-dependent oxidoreductase [Candidatus Handelsmanbacteria bacterium]